MSKRNRSDDVETEHEKKEAQRKKYAYVACEVLSSEVWSITEAIMENREHLRQFWQYIHRPAPLDPLQAGYFTKVNEALLDKKTEEMFKLIGTKVEVKLNTVERCSGHAGTYGVKLPTHPVAMKIGKPVFKAMAKEDPDYISSDCALAGHHIAQGMQIAGTPARALQHPLSLLRIAYGME